MTTVYTRFHYHLNIFIYWTRTRSGSTSWFYSLVPFFFHRFMFRQHTFYHHNNNGADSKNTQKWQQLSNESVHPHTKLVTTGVVNPKEIEKTQCFSYFYRKYFVAGRRRKRRRRLKKLSKKMFVIDRNANTRKFNSSHFLDLQIAHIQITPSPATFQQ